jgi:hypothetical protein
MECTATFGILSKKNRVLAYLAKSRMTIVVRKGNHDQSFFDRPMANRQLTIVSNNKLLILTIAETSLRVNHKSEAPSL